MPSLFERLADVNLDEAGNDRIPLHGFKTMVNWVDAGNMDIPGLAAFYSMDADQTTDLVRLFTAYAAISGVDDNETAILKAEFVRNVFDFLVGSEMELLPDFAVEANFWSFIGA